MASTNYNSAKSNTAGIAARGPPLVKEAGIQGDPIPGVDVSIEQSPGGIIIATTQTNTSGSYQFTGLAPGTYKVRSGGRQADLVVGPQDGGRASGTVRSSGIAASAKPTSKA